MNAKKESQDLSDSSLFVEKSGRLKISARLFHIGEDLHIFLFGGQPHLGALALASPGDGASACSAREHRDNEPAMEMAARLSAATGKRVGVSCGIHYDNLKRSELADILEICGRLGQRIVCFLSSPSKHQEGHMLDIEELDKFAQFIRSGALEEKFKCGSEETRHKILELLEKLMDTADLADECATRLIFRGLKSFSPDAGDPGAKRLQ